MSETGEARERRWLPLALANLGLAVLALPVFDPGVQLFYRDTARFYYPIKKFIADELRAGRIPLWDPWTEAGTSMLGQVTPALLHPLNLLYLVLPFDLAFKLNCLGALPLACAGAYLLARRLGASRWGAAIAGAGFAGSGYLVSQLASNLPYGLGLATVPLAVEAFLRHLDRRTPATLLWAAAALALCFLSADPQSMLFAGLLGTAFGVARAASAHGARGAARAGVLAAAWGAAGLLLAAPAAFPALVQLRESARVQGNTEKELETFQNHPVRLAGLLVPRAFDETFEGPVPYTEYWSDFLGAFAESITIGAPLLLFAFCAVSLRAGRALLLAALACLLVSTGTVLGFHTLLVGLPGFNLFRYAEKYVGPATLLIALAAALGWDAVARRREAARLLLGAAAGLAIALGAVALIAAQAPPSLVQAIAARGTTQKAEIALALLQLLKEGVLLAAAMCAAVALVAFLRLWQPPREAVLGGLALGMVCVAAMIATRPALATMPLELLRPPFPTADLLLQRAGPSAGSWRLHSRYNNPAIGPRFKFLDRRTSVTAALIVNLMPHFDSLAGLEGTAAYFSAPDPAYEGAIAAAPGPVLSLLNVRFVIFTRFDLTAAQAARLGFESIPLGWLKEVPRLPRAFLVEDVRALPPAQALAVLAARRTDLRRTAVVRPESAAATAHLRTPSPDAPIEAHVERRGPDRRDVTMDTPRGGLLLVSEHFDPGWRATIDGRPAQVLRADEVILGVVVPPGRHAIRLVFWPRGLTAGLWGFAVALGVLLSAIGAGMGRAKMQG